VQRTCKPHPLTRAVVVITAGLGPELKQAMLDQARPYLLRIIGPNCLGIAVPGLGLHANFGLNQPAPGKLAFLSQSGALVTGILDWAEMCRTLGFAISPDPGDLSILKVRLTLPSRLRAATEAAC